jgi:hypothetical protein
MAKRQGEFSTKTKRERLKQSGGFCEAQGPEYGLVRGARCNADLGRGVEFDHYIALAIGGGADLDNCRAVCLQCHKHKTRTNDVPKAAKTKRQSDKSKGIRRPKGTLKSAGFPKVEKAKGDLAKTSKTKLPPRPLFRSAE